MHEILKMLNELKADELDGLIVRAKILLEKSARRRLNRRCWRRNACVRKKSSRKNDASRKSRSFSANCRSFRVRSRTSRNL